MSDPGYFRLFSTRAHNARYTPKSRPSVAKAKFSAVLVCCTSTSGLDSGRPRWTGADPQRKSRAMESQLNKANLKGLP